MCVDEVLRVGRELNLVIAFVGSERDVALPVEADPAVVSEVRILTSLTAVRVEPHRARLLVDPVDLRHRALAARDLVLEGACT